MAYGNDNKLANNTSIDDMTLYKLNNRFYRLIPNISSLCCVGKIILSEYIGNNSACKTGPYKILLQITNSIFIDYFIKLSKRIFTLLNENISKKTSEQIENYSPVIDNQYIRVNYPDFFAIKFNDCGMNKHNLLHGLILKCKSHTMLSNETIFAAYMTIWQLEQSQGFSLVIE